MKNSILYFILFSSQILFSQNIICTYGVKVDSVYLNQNKLDVNEIYYNYINYLDKISYHLRIMNDESIYEIDRELLKKVNDPSVKLMQSVGGRGVFYYNSKDSLFLNRKELLGDIYLIEQEKPIWVFTSESKNIDGIECLKAFSTKKMNNSKRKWDRITTAWYAPSMPYSFGPKNFNGLPGLILELQENEVVLYLTKIEFLDSESKIEVPDKGIKMTEKEYEKFLIENGENLLLNKILKN
jgi:GLPGLI family protein